jgi:cytochrome c peroxidase
VREGKATVAAWPTPADYQDLPPTSWVLVTTGGPGKVVLEARAGDYVATGTYHVTAYTAAQLEVGRARYYTPADESRPGRASCASCHQKADGPDHTPMTASPFDDDVLHRVITTGRYDDDAHLEVAHDWNVTDDEKLGLIAFLRALPPRGD